MEFKFVPNQKPVKVDVITLRRQKLVRRIDQQVGFVRSMIEGNNPRGSWVWMDETGTYFVPIKYGRHPLELKKGMFSVQCQDLDHVEAALCAMRALVLQGDFDAQLQKASTDIRSRFGKE